ncbi:hypothetical protein C2W62_42525 [Candidatus Entotheonella serta]|nr:hypothetical protein C2W62_42525 [Candidatus Entotheonella serta]
MLTQRAVRSQESEHLTANTLHFSNALALILYRSGLNVSQALDKIKLQAGQSGPVTRLVQFIECSKRGICSQAGAPLLEVDA